MDLLSDLIIEPKLAPLKYRLSASLIDFLILFLVSFFIGNLFGETHNHDGSIGFSVSGWPALLLYLIDIGLMPIQEGLTGRTIGKRIVKIKVMKDDFSDNSVSASIIRHLFDIVDIFAFAGLFVASATAKKQRIGDLVAKTVVVID